jgi:adenylate cyclase
MVSSDLEWKPSLRVLEQVKATKRTVWTEAPAADYSQKWLSAVVAAPIRDRHGEVIGALYGDRRGDLKGSTVARISDTDITLIELLGYGIALGIERATQERAAAEQRVLFEQFFSRKLSEQLAVNPNLLKGRDAEVTVLFCDIRSFSRRAKEMGTEQTLLWINDVLEVCSQCVLARDGVVVDYTGDEIMSMWGAPVPQQDQAQRACEAAKDILRALPQINERWSGQLKEPVKVGIGINTGTAQVGNIGSKVKFKYGPLGHPVNLASRVQGANKYLKTSALITQATRDRLPPETPVRRICSVRVVNMAEPVTLYELRLDDDDQGRKLCELYEQALGHFESKDFRKAARVIGEYLPDYADDGPSQLLLWRSVNWLVNPRRKFRKSWRLPGK